MSLSIVGYNFIETIYEGTTTLVYRAYRELDQALVIIKTLTAEYPTLEQLSRLKHEYKLLQSLDIEGIAQPLALLNYKNGLALILPDLGGESLRKLLNLQKVIELSKFLPISIQIASILGKLHQNNIIHKDINPNNILIDEKINQVRIIDFSISSYLSRENQITSNPNLLEGTLSYISPEQTGRMNRSIDYRTDFYSLGVTFYEMLTGQLPFLATDSLELVHCHIAKTPLLPHLINSEIPEVVSDIVMKLLAKTAEDRYQSALGLKADLEICLRMLQTSGNIAHFQVGELDSFSQFTIPQKLYGREREVSLLMDAFARVSNPPQPPPGKREKGGVEMMLISGYSGIGKSYLVNEIHKPIVEARGYFITGKFDQFQRNVPYSAVIYAFQALMKQLLTESETQLAQWKDKLVAALGTNAQVIIDVVPEVELILGKQPAALELGLTEAQNRFNLIFQSFIHVFCSKEHPLVIFLDDLQWADSATRTELDLRFDAVKVVDPQRDIQPGQIYCHRTFNLQTDPEMETSLGVSGHTGVVLGFISQGKDSQIVVQACSRDMPSVEGVGIQQFPLFPQPRQKPDSTPMNNKVMLFGAREATLKYAAASLEGAESIRPKGKEESKTNKLRIGE